MAELAGWLSGWLAVWVARWVASPVAGGGASGRTQLGIYPEIVAHVSRSSSRSLAVLAAVWNTEVAGSNPGWVMQRVRFRFRFAKVAGSNPSCAMLGIYPEIVAQASRSSSRSLAVLAAVWNAKVAGSNPGCVMIMHVFAKPIS